MADIQKNADEMNKKFNSPEWKQKMEDMKKLYDSPEYKELRKKYDSEVEELKKAKGIKSDKAFLLFDGSNVDKVFLPFSGDFNTVFASVLPLNFKSENFKFETLKNFEAISTPLFKSATPLTTPTKVKVN